VLVTIRVSLAGGSERLLSAEVTEAPSAPEDLLGNFERNGRLAVGDREDVPFEEVVNVEFAAAEAQTSPPWFAGLHDEDVASAMEGRFETPPHEA
jgi:hypothetical protein